MKTTSNNPKNKRKEKLSRRVNAALDRIEGISPGQALKASAQKKKKPKAYKPPAKYPNAKKLAKAYNDRKKRSNFNIDKDLSKGKLISYRIINFVALAAAVLYAVFYARLSYVRLFSAVKDLGTSIAYYVLMFSPDTPFEPSINVIPDMSIDVLLPSDFNLFKENMSKLFPALFSGENFLNFLLSFSSGALVFCQLALVLLLMYIAIVTVIDTMLSTANGKWFERTKPHRWFEKNIYVGAYVPTKRYISDYFKYNRGHYLFPLLGFLWLCSFNIVTIIVEAFAYFFYIARSFNFLRIWVQLYRLALDVGIFSQTTFFLIQIPLIYVFFDKWRKKLAMKHLAGMEGRNRQFINKLSMAIMITSSMGSGKTTLLTDIALSLSLMWRNEALTRMYKYFKYFPDFDWFKFRKYLELAIKRRDIYNLATTEAYIRWLADEFDKHPERRNIFGYDFKNHKMWHNNGLTDVYIWEALETYAKLYFIYIMETSLICANYPIREDYIIVNAGNLILYEDNLFTHPITKDTTHFAHILNYDLLRMGKTLVKDAAYRNSFEFGIVAITEGGKERGNAIENICIKKTAEECNVKNDEMNVRVMMSRHPAVVDNFPFVKFLLDEQRDMTLGASFRELCEIIEIEEKGDTKLAIPFYFFALAVYDIFNPLLFKLNTMYEHTHGNVSLFVRLFRSFCCMIINPIERVIERYSYHELRIRMGKATSDERNEYKYYIVHSKIYRERFSTNTHNCYFRKRAIQSPIGFPDYPTYTSTDMTDEQLHQQASLWVENLDILSGQIPAATEEIKPIKPQQKLKTERKEKIPEEQEDAISFETDEIKEEEAAEAYDMSFLFEGMNKV